MNEVDLAYVAGFFDGEGSAFVLTPKANNGKRYPRLVAQIAQIDREVLDWIKSEFGGGVYLKGQNTNCHQFRVSSKAARKFLTAIEPYLRVKKSNVTALLDLHGREVR